MGSDTNAGDQAHPLGSVSKAAQVALNNYKIIVAAGTYQGNITTTPVGKAPQVLQFVADVADGTVVINAVGSKVGFQLNNSPNTLIDGFTIKGATDAAIVIKSGSNGFTIQNCFVHDNPGDGIRVQDSASVLVFNNLVYNNGGAGIAIVGQGSGSTNAPLASPNARLYNNTILGNDDHGITLGTTAAASPGASVLNNIVQDNDATSPSENIKAITSPYPRSDLNYNGNCNLVHPATYNPSYLRGPDDFAGDALFVNPPSDFHLLSSSPAIDRSDPNNCALVGLGNSQENILKSRTTTGTNSNPGLPDAKPYDLGFHFLRTR